MGARMFLGVIDVELSLEGVCNSQTAEPGQRT